MTRTRILLVDDDEGFASSLVVVLETSGYDVTHCADGASGLAAAQDGDFDLVITDYRMPGMGGTGRA